MALSIPSSFVNHLFISLVTSSRSLALKGRKERMGGKEEFYLRERLEHVKVKMERRKAEDSFSSQDWKDGQREGWGGSGLTQQWQ